MKRTLFLLLVITPLTFVSGQDNPSPGKGPQLEALSVEKAQSLLQIAPGLKIEAVATDPLIHSPVAAIFDEKQRLWVVEMPDYPNGPKPGNPPEGAIKILEDTNGDGRFDKATLFADKLLFANGVLPWKDGAFVTCAPHILFLRDTNGDGKADSREVLFEGFAALNPQLRVSFPVLGPDGWVYVANGLRGGQIVRPGKGEKPISLAGMDFRFDPRKGNGESTTGPGQFGNCIDAWGNRFVCDNRHHLRHVVFDNRYLKRNPLAAAGELVEDVDGSAAGPLSSGSKIYPLSRNWTTSNLHAGRFTAACGVFIFQGSLLGNNHTNNAFTCDPTGNLVHEEILTPNGATFSGKPSLMGKEFLATTDEWFRPVNLTHGPDGALYVIDMCRAVIEHPEFMPVELKNRPDLVLGKEKGRIWRIFNPAMPIKKDMPGLVQGNHQDLVNHLGNGEGWWRDTAKRLILQKSDPAIIPYLKKAVNSKGNLLQTFNAAWLLHSLDALTSVELETLLAHEDPRLQATGVRLAESASNLNLFGEKISALSDSADAQLRYQVALTASYLPAPLITQTLKKITLAGPMDKWIRLAIAVSAGQNAGKLAQEIAQQKGVPESTLPLLKDLALQAGTRKEIGEVQIVLETAADSKTPREVAQALLAGLATGFAKRGTNLDAFLETPEISSMVKEKTRNYLASQSTWALNRMVSNEDRVEAIQLLGMAPKKVAQPILEKLLREDPTPEIRLAAVRSLATGADGSLQQILFRDWKTQPPAVRKEILEAMTRSPGRIQILLSLVEKGELSAREIDPTRARLLLAHANPSIKEKANKVLAAALPTNRAKVLEQYQVSIKTPGNALNGKIIFQKQCATCHRVGSVGVEIGPDISDTRTKTPAQLLNDILNPNQAIDNNYINYTVTLKNGRISTGMISSSNASGITLRRAENQTEALLHQDIEEITSTGVSLMPEGLEKDINEKGMADLISFLKNWRYLDGATPFGSD